MGHLSLYKLISSNLRFQYYCLAIVQLSAELSFFLLSGCLYILMIPVFQLQSFLSVFCKHFLKQILPEKIQLRVQSSEFKDRCIRSHSYQESFFRWIRSENQQRFELESKEELNMLKSCYTVYLMVAYMVLLFLANFHRIFAFEKLIYEKIVMPM